MPPKFTHLLLVTHPTLPKNFIELRWQHFHLYWSQTDQGSIHNLLGGDENGSGQYTVSTKCKPIFFHNFRNCWQISIKFGR